MFEVMRLSPSRRWLVVVPLAAAAVVSAGLLTTDPVSLFQGPARRPPFPPTHTVRGAAITVPGNYHYPDATQLVVRLEPDGEGHAVEYQLYRNGKVVLVSGNVASAMHRWAFTLDDQDRLWFYSADIGLSVWLPVTERGARPRWSINQNCCRPFPLNDHFLWAAA